MSEASTSDHAAERTAGRHRGEASAEEAERTAQQPHGRHRRPQEG